MKIAVGQMAVDSLKSDNLGKIEFLCAQAEEQGAQLIAFPEGTMFNANDTSVVLMPHAEQLNGPFVQQLKHLAKKHKLWIVAGMFEASADPTRVYNTLVLIDNLGEFRDSYRKIHLYDAFGYKESDRMLSGDGNTMIFHCEGITFGVMTCYDLRFPELARHLAYQGADAIILPCAWHNGPLKEVHFETLARARAIENNIYMVTAVQVGENYTGTSRVIDPMGVVQASMGEQEGLLVSELLKERVDIVREFSPTLQNRRTDVYSRWTDTRWYD